MSQKIVAHVFLNGTRNSYFSWAVTHADETRDFFPDYYRLKAPENDLSCYDPNAIYIAKEDMAKLKPVPITASLLRSASKYHIIV